MSHSTQTRLDPVAIRKLVNKAFIDAFDVGIADKFPEIQGKSNRKNARANVTTGGLNRARGGVISTSAPTQTAVLLQRITNTRERIAKETGQPPRDEEAISRARKEAETNRNKPSAAQIRASARLAGIRKRNRKGIKSKSKTGGINRQLVLSGSKAKKKKRQNQLSGVFGIGN